MATTWQNNALIVENADSMTTIIDMPRDVVKLNTHSSIFPPTDKVGSVKSVCHGLSVNLALDQISFSSSDTVSGKLLLDCPKKKLKLGKIEVRVFGFQDVRLKKGKSQQILLYSHLFNIQSPRTPPSAAVFPGPLDEDGCWLARPGRIGFDFSIPLSKDAIKNSNNPNLQIVEECPGPIPSTVWKKKIGGIRHIVAAIVHYKNDCVQVPLGKYQEILVFEHYQTSLNSFWFAPNTMNASSSLELKRGVLYKSKGQLNLSVGLRARETETCSDSGLWIAGNVGYVHVMIENTTHKEVKSIGLSLIKRFKTFKEVVDEAGQKSLQPLNFVREIIASKLWKSSKVDRKSGKNILKEPLSEDYQFNQVVNEWKILPGDSRNMMFELEIPSSAKSIRFAMLVDVSFVVQVKVTLKGGKSVECEVPITILNCRSIMASSPLLSLKSTSDFQTVREENFSSKSAPLVENLSSNSEISPPILTKDETLCENKLLDAVNEAQTSRKSLDSTDLLKKRESVPRSLTFGSRRLDSIRFKEGLKLENPRYHSLPRGISMPIKVKTIEAEIDDIFEKVF